MSDSTNEWEESIRVACADLADLLVRKQHDYGTANLEAFGEFGVLVRSTDKISRLQNLLKKQNDPNINLGAFAQPHFETVEDTWQDLAGYGVLGLIMHRRTKK